MKSPAWAIRREHYAAHERLITGHEPVCAVCAKPWSTGLDLHHLDYTRLGHESHDDLLPLCREHHEQLHAVYDSHRHWKKAGLRSSTAQIVELLRGEGRRPQKRIPRAVVHPGP